MWVLCGVDGYWYSSWIVWVLVVIIVVVFGGVVLWYWYLVVLEFVRFGFFLIGLINVLCLDMLFFVFLIL